MIRRGRTEGWLSRPVSALRTWASLSGASFKHVRVGHMPGLEHRGSAIIAERALSGNDYDPLVTVSRGLILSKDRVDEQSKTDGNLKEVLDSLGDFGKVNKVPDS